MRRMRPVCWIVVGMTLGAWVGIGFNALVWLSPWRFYWIAGAVAVVGIGGFLAVLRLLAWIMAAKGIAG